MKNAFTVGAGGSCPKAKNPELRLQGPFCKDATGSFFFFPILSPNPAFLQDL